jgi:hypothetical protein
MQFAYELTYVFFKWMDKWQVEDEEWKVASDWRVESGDQPLTTTTYH